MEPRYTLAVQYLDCLQVTRGLTREDLASPNIFRACGNRIANTSGDVPHKFTTARFEDASGSDLSANPLEWPRGEVYETGLGPWRYSEQELRAIPGCWPESFSLEDLALSLCLDQLEFNGYDGFEVVKDEDGNWAGKTFDLAGVNAPLLEALDQAEWRLRKERPVIEEKITPGEVPEPLNCIGAWYSVEGGTARLFWDRDRMIDGAYLQRRRPGQLDTLCRYDTVPEALLALSLLPGGPADPLNTIGHTSPYWGGDIRGAIENTQIAAR